MLFDWIQIRHTHTHTHSAVLRPFIRDYPGRPVQEETLTHSQLKYVVGVCHHSGFYEA